MLLLPMLAYLFGIIQLASAGATPSFDFTINFGNVLTITSFLVGGLSFVFLMRNQVGLIAKESTDLREQMRAMQTELRKLTDIMIAQGRQDERITAMDQRMVGQGKRIDDLTRRVNTYLDMKAVSLLEDEEM